MGILSDFVVADPADADDLESVAARDPSARIQSKGFTELERGVPLQQWLTATAGEMPAAAIRAARWERAIASSSAAQRRVTRCPSDASRAAEAPGSRRAAAACSRRSFDQSAQVRIVADIISTRASAAPSLARRRCTRDRQPRVPRQRESHAGQSGGAVAATRDLCA